MEDSRIIQLFFQRDEEAIEEVSRKYSAYCSKIVWNVLYNKEDCDECLNDVWFTLWSRIPPDRPKCLREILNDFLGTLSRKDRDIFVRRYWYMDSIREIAQRHQVTETNVKSNLYRSRKKLLKIMNKEGIL